MTQSERDKAIDRAHAKAELTGRNMVVWCLPETASVASRPLYRVLPEHHSPEDLGGFGLDGFVPLVTVKPWPGWPRS